MERVFRNQRGAVLVTFVVLLTVLLGFTALAWEAGKWYLVKAETSKAVDAAALVGAKNISNPNVDLETLCEEFAQENFSDGYLGTQGRSFAVDVTETEQGKIKVTGSSTAVAVLARLFGVDTVPVSSYGAAAKKEVEIMLVLDRSGSMAGTPIGDLKDAAVSFVGFFEETQHKDKLGLISFATGVTVDRPLGTDFVDDMTARINDMTAVGATNAEDAIDQSDGPQGFTDQTGIPGDQRVQQFLLFFTDGRPTAFRGKFRRNGTDYDAVVMGTGNFCGTVYGYMGHTDSENFYGTSTLTPTPTGDGNKTSGSPLTTCGAPSHRYLNTRWYIFGDSKYGLSGYDPLECSIPENVLAPYICDIAKRMAIDHAQELKDKNIKIYIIGLEGNGGVDRDFLGAIASGENFEYYAPDSGELEAIFNTIAKEIKLRLVE